MFLEKIQISNFRNITNTKLTFNSKFNIIHGDNGNGKTNLLEAIYYTTSLKPIKKKNKLTHLINDKAQHSILNSTFKNNSYREEIKIIITPQKKALIYNNNTNTDIKSYLHKFQAVLFTPDDLMIIKGEPEMRRELFNKAIFHSNQFYYSYIRDYNRILKSRNKILKEMHENKTNNSELLNALNQQFANLSLKIYEERINYLIDYIPILIKIINNLSNKEYLPYLVYKTDFNYKDREQFLLKLKNKQYLEIRQKRTLIGPHLDDYKIMTNDKEIRFFGSQGEIRLFALAIKISQIVYIYEKTNQYPILLLDDISSELDEKRKDFLFNFLKTIDTQIFITTTSLSNLPKLESSSFYHVKNGDFS